MHTTNNNKNNNNSENSKNKAKHNAGNNNTDSHQHDSGCEHYNNSGNNNDNNNNNNHNNNNNNNKNNANDTITRVARPPRGAFSEHARAILIETAAPTQTDDSLNADGLMHYLSIITSQPTTFKCISRKHGISDSMVHEFAWFFYGGRSLLLDGRPLGPLRLREGLQRSDHT